MRAEYDSDVNPLSIDVLDREHLDVADPIDEWYCRVGLVDGKPANVELLDATDRVVTLEVAPA